MSNLIVAIAPNLIIVLLARFLLGAAISAFWAMSITVAARLAGPENLGRGVMFTSAGVSLATVAGVPLGVMLSELVDWRMVFAIAGVLMVVLAVVLRFALPSVPADRTFAFFAVFAPLVIAVSVMSMILFSGSIVGVGIVVLVWGFFFSSWLIVANTWVGHRMPDRLEAGGSLVVVGFQGAITLAAGIGGLLVDTLNVELVYVIGSIALLAGAVLFGASNRVSSRA
ncbi:MFS transporter [Microbacterium sp. PAMC22086]|uniref:MFS transporter n=1 Tax=Microbacterium sp. PAMC22086 TaxID=2861281 RepID=UPI0021598B22|nr:MFS transporter [Microbacterium sp. PAMC22086]